MVRNRRSSHQGRAPSSKQPRRYLRRVSRCRAVKARVERVRRGEADRRERGASPARGIRPRQRSHSPSASLLMQKRRRLRSDDWQKCPGIQTSSLHVKRLLRQSPICSRARGLLGSPVFRTGGVIVIGGWRGCCSARKSPAFQALHKGGVWNIAYQAAEKSTRPMSTNEGPRGASIRSMDEAHPSVGAAVQVEPMVSPASFKSRAYTALKNVIVSLDVYRQRSEVRLDERRLAQEFGISRTPVREAMAQLEREGFVRSVPRRGIYVVRKSKREVIEMITAWAALESMAARLITENAANDDIASLRTMFTKFENGELHARLDEYSEVNIEFHQTIIRMSRNSVLIALAENLFTHMRMIRMKTIGEKDRADRSIHDHMHIIEALEARDTARAEELVRTHALGLAEHVAKYADYLD